LGLPQRAAAGQATAAPHPRAIGGPHWHKSYNDRFALRWHDQRLGGRRERRQPTARLSSPGTTVDGLTYSDEPEYEVRFIGNAAGTDVGDPMPWS